MPKYNEMKEKPLFNIEGAVQNLVNELVVSNKNQPAARLTSGEGSLKHQRMQLDVRELPTVDEVALKRHRSMGNR